ncbi:1-acyl-sn-glycerol-3-phosphate acyltransferase [Novosphingobium sp. Gsoil 351]|uniref:lysophospholipid acyltransferase family protein n=1 Tax=Novosphingobium sp. Gsoil 351 TaxID=2675225 RepID=UPI0012B48A88|nr:lysophospholipid acyltransferase family protein [Novosphingobium sp. Gsoil 351]QGN55552.1 1-acyl-sn-glycerol-3-phosphate acyltransferase [Novosphingobium sp. Gsoil 351]
MALTLAAPAPITGLGKVRMAVRLSAMAGLLLICVPGYYAFRVLRLPNPWPRWFLGAIATIAGVKVRIAGERVRRGAFFLSNHVSWLDVPALAGASGAAFVAHDGLAAFPVLKWLCEMNDTVFVARHDRASVARQIALVRAAIAQTAALAVFPEGTTSDGTGLLPFKSSLLSALDPVPAGIAVQPVVLDYGADAPEIAWVGEEHGLDNFKRILARGRPIHLTVRFLPPLEGEALRDRKTMAAAARGVMLAELQRSHAV